MLLTRGRICDVVERVSQLVKSMDYYPMLLFHVGTDDTASQKKIGRINEEDRALVRQAKNTGAKIIFLSILLVSEAGTARSRCIVQINGLLQGWSCREGFGFYDNGSRFNDCRLIGRDGFHLSRRDKRIFGHRLANLVSRF